MTDTTSPTNTPSFISDSRVPTALIERLKRAYRALHARQSHPSTWHPTGPFCADCDTMAKRLQDAVTQLNDKYYLYISHANMVLREAQRTNQFPMDNDLKHVLHILRRFKTLATSQQERPASELPDDLHALLSTVSDNRKRSILCSFAEWLVTLTPRATEIANRDSGLAFPIRKRQMMHERSLKTEIETALRRINEGEDRINNEHASRVSAKIAPQLAAHWNGYKSATDAAMHLLSESKLMHRKNIEQQNKINQIWKVLNDKLLFVGREPPQLASVDMQLVQTWSSNKPGKPYWEKAMISARRAELVAIDIYNQLYGSAVDLSRLQIICPADKRWTFADIETPKYEVDVKNAMTAYESTTRYTDHVVKRFKYDRHGQDVVISGFLSQYSDDCKVSWLGETTASRIKRICNEFNTSYLQLDLSAKSDLLPPWIFEYPRELYREVDDTLEHLREPVFQFPAVELPIAVGLLAKRVKAIDDENMLAEAKALSKRFDKNGTIIRPRLYLHILDRFCQAVVGRREFNGGCLSEILFPSRPGIAMQTVDIRKTPLAILDPVEIVYELLDVLQTISKLVQIREYGFRNFKLIGNGIFRGMRSDGKWQTIIAYCGGWMEKPRIRCGNTPLHLGVHAICDELNCGYLVCDRCGLCQEGCAGKNKRRGLSTT